ncbi:MAG: gamma-glutamyltransferase, partial [Methylocystaceae bacterium]|nr:gamma-glutamyltransferase [Methylocystaceae bacterium]
MHNFSHAQNISKKVCRSSHGIVVSQHRQASEVGAEILRQGGNAIDAAIAVSFALGALEPWMSGLGGGGYMVCRFAKDNDVKVIDFGMRSPSGLDPADYPIVEGEANDLFPWPKVKDEANVIGATSIAIPGVVAGMQTAFENYGTFDWKKLVQPAIDFAKKGILIDWYTQLILSGSGADIARFDKTSEIFLDENKRPKVGSWVLTNENRIILNELAHTLETLRDLGGGAFYHGELAENIVADINAEGGCFHLSDLNSYEAKLVDPLVMPYSSGSIYVTPEMTAGPTLMNVMNALTRSELDPDQPDAKSFSAYAESLLNAYSDRLLNMGDTSADVQNEGCTSHFNIVDKDGNMV